MTIAEAGELDTQVTLLVRSAVLESVNVPTATSPSVKPTGMLEFAGLIAIESNPLTNDTRPILVAPLSR